ncbi:hypothetical protein HQ535_05465, partial [bacterium]|nr:hypothetical protein [bacterium]
MRSYLKHNRSMVFVGMGTILFATSVLWEFSRMNPQFRYLVEPWSLRGFETDQGLVFVIVAVAVLTLAVLITTGVIKETWPHNIGVVAAVTAVAT